LRLKIKPAEFRRILLSFSALAVNGLKANVEQGTGLKDMSGPKSVYGLDRTEFAYCPRVGKCDFTTLCFQRFRVRVRKRVFGALTHTR